MNYRAGGRAASKVATTKSGTASPAFHISLKRKSGASCGVFTSRESGKIPPLLEKAGGNRNGSNVRI
jgi:hypothetical protein